MSIQNDLLNFSANSSDRFSYGSFNSAEERDEFIAEMEINVPDGLTLIAEDSWSDYETGGASVLFIDSSGSLFMQDLDETELESITFSDWQDLVEAYTDMGAYG